MANNGYAALVAVRADASGKKRRKLDDYETPQPHTAQLLAHVKFQGPTITEPACGGGLMVRALRFGTGLKVLASDLKTGANFLKRTQKIAGDCITNPPYGNGNADAFVTHALSLTEGRVAMLMEAKYVFGSRRYQWLFSQTKPEKVIVIPERIYFLVAGKPLKSQFFNHIWIVWPDRKTRLKGGYACETIWAEPSGDSI